MSRIFSHETRVLACSSCGAPLEAMARGGTMQCRYCGATNMLAPRAEQAAQPPARTEPLDEGERIRRLRAQDGSTARVPTSVKGLLADDGTIPEWKVREAISVWQSARVEVGDVGGYEAAELLLFLTTLLGAHYRDHGEPLRQRAMLESALEVFGLPRHVQIVRGHLARSAASAGDLDAAERWLAPCDPRSDDLQTDSAYRFSRALIDTARGDGAAVHAVLGSADGEVPLMSELEGMATLLRAHACDTQGREDQAVAVLRAALERAQGPALAQARIELADWKLCERSFPKAQRAHRQATAAEASPSGLTGVFLLGLAALLGVIGGGLVLGGVVCLGISLISVVAPAVTGGGEAAWFAGGTIAFSMAVTGVSLIGPGAGLLVTAAIPGWIGRRLRAVSRKEALLLTKGIDGQAEVVSVEPTNVTVDGVPRYHIALRVAQQGKPPVDATVGATLTAAQARRVQPGSTVPVLVDPDDPRHLRLEL